jgi:DNA transposition AAA+ family ATPase
MSNITPLHPENTRDLRAEIAALQARDTKLTQSEIARLSGIGSSRLNRWLKGLYEGDNQSLESDLARWIDAYNVRLIESRALPTAPAWVSTPSGAKVLAALGYAQVAGDISLVYGGAGLGKTSTILEYERTNPNVWIATMTPASATVVPALEEIALALGLRELPGGAARIQRAIIARLRGTHGLLVIDEAQHLGVAALDEVRALHDATGLGIALVGNESVYARMTGGNRAAYLDRLFSRIGKRVRLVRASRDDIDALIDAWALKTKDCRQALHDIAGKPGGLRGLTKVMRLASMFAHGAKRAVSCEDIRAAWRDLGGES